MARRKADRSGSRGGDVPSDGAADAPAASRATGSGLKAALVQHARRLIEALGPDGLTLRAAAKAAGASHNAPYIYFPGGLTQLHAAVAVEGFRELLPAIREPRSLNSVADIEDRATSAEPEESMRVREMVSSYVRFGVEHPNLYRAMFHARLAEPLDNVWRERSPDDRGAKTFQDLADIKSDAFAAIVARLAELKRTGRLRPPHPEDGALAVAALAHGLVGEFIDEGLWRERHEEPWSSKRQMMTSAITDMLLHGLLAPRQ